MPIRVLVGDVARVLDREHRLHRRDRDGELVEVGLAGRELLQLQAGPHHGPHPAPAAVAPGELDDLEGDAGDQRHADDAREHEPVPGGQADRGEDEDRHDHHDEQEARAAARVQAAEALGVLGRERRAPPRSRRSSCARRRGTRRRGAGRAGARAAAGSRGRSRCARSPRRARRGRTSSSWSLMRLVSPTGTTKNRPTASASATTTVPTHMPPEISFSSSGSCALAEMPSALKPMTSDSTSATTPRTIGRRSSAVLLEDRRERERGDLDLAVGPALGVDAVLGDLLGQRLAHGDRPGRHATHHHALEHGLTARRGRRAGR